MTATAEVHAPIISGVVGRVDGVNRYYTDPASGENYESVTSIIACTDGDMEWLGPWSAKLSAEYCVDHLDLIHQVIAGSSRDGAIDLIKGEARRLREVKREIGSYQHSVIEALILDTPIPTVPDHLVGVEIDGESVDQDVITDGFLQFCVDHDPVFEMSEATVANPMLGYAGTLDIVAVLPAMRRRMLIDAKTGNKLARTMGAQLSAYRESTEVWIDDLGNKMPMPAVDGAAILHIKTSYRRGYKLYEVDAGPNEFAWFRQMMRVAEGHRAASKLATRALYPALPDGSQPPPLIEDCDELGRAKAPLLKAGIESLSDVAAMTEVQVRAVSGIGPKSMPVIRQALTDHGLAFAANLAVV